MGGQVPVIQEWLSLRGHNVAIDGAFGPATEGTVRRFQAVNSLPVTGIVDADTFSHLSAPLTKAVAPISGAGKTLNDLILAYAGQHLAQHPLEVGGQNCGPWVRSYLEGNQGDNWPWCAGFACFILRQACDALGRPMPIKRTFSCDILAGRAMAAGIFISGREIAKGNVAKDQIPPGSFFVNRRTDDDWNHTGIAIAFHDDYFETIEGNTNDAGDREGYEVCRRIRGYEGKDFVRIS
jgi:peptidoglycan hydrolase-like protein with peptidoglycan-binding domain